MHFRSFLMLVLMTSAVFAQPKSAVLVSAQATNDEMVPKSLDRVKLNRPENTVNLETEKMQRNEFCRSLFKVADAFPQDFSYLKGEKNIYGEWKSKVVNSLMSDICVKQMPEGEYSWTGNVTQQADWKKANVEYQKITQNLRSCALIKEFQPEENISMNKEDITQNKEGSNILHTWTVVEPIETPYLGMQIATELKFKSGNWHVMVWMKKIKTF